MNSEDQAFLAWTQEEEGIQRQKFLILLKDGLNLHFLNKFIECFVGLFKDLYRKFVRRWRNM